MNNDFNITAENASYYIKKRNQMAAVRNALIGVVQTSIFLDDQSFVLMAGCAYLLAEASRIGDRCAEVVSNSTSYYGVPVMHNGKSFIQKQLGFSIATSGVAAYVMNLML